VARVKGPTCQPEGGRIFENIPTVMAMVSAVLHGEGFEAHREMISSDVTFVRDGREWFRYQRYGPAPR